MPSTPSTTRRATLRARMRRLAAWAALAPAAVTACGTGLLLQYAAGTGVASPGVLRVQAYALAALGAFLTVATVAGVLVAGRSLRGRVDEVGQMALRVAQHQIPDLVRRLQAGEPVDADTLPAPSGAGDEFGAIGDALARLARLAGDSAFVLFKERDGFDRFTSSAATRALVAADMALKGLDRLQRHPRLEEDTKNELANIDAASTRLRRHLENLLLLAGGTIPHPHTRPLSLGNLLLDAASETPQPERITYEFGPEGWIVPEAGGALTHLVAELLDNAVAFTHPDLPVTARCLGTGTGLAIEIEDRGRGLSTARLGELNQRLQQTPLFAQIAESEQLGMFVVGRLAHQYGLTVKLRTSVFGGLSVIVLLPASLLTSAPPPAPEPRTIPLPSRPGESSAAARGPRPARLATLPQRRRVLAEAAPFTPAPADVQPVRNAAPIEPAAVPAPPRTVDGLPQRRPGAHLAAELRIPQPQPAGSRRSASDTRSPEEIEALFAHFPTAKDNP